MKRVRGHVLALTFSSKEDLIEFTEDVFGGKVFYLENNFDVAVVKADTLHPEFGGQPPANSYVIRNGNDLERNYGNRIIKMFKRNKDGEDND